MLEPVPRPARAQLTSANRPDDTEGDPVRPRGSRGRPGHAGQHLLPPAGTETDMKFKNTLDYELQGKAGESDSLTLTRRSRR